MSAMILSIIQLAKTTSKGNRALLGLVSTKRLTSSSSKNQNRWNDRNTEEMSSNNEGLRMDELEAKISFLNDKISSMVKEIEENKKEISFLVNESQERTKENQERTKEIRGIRQALSPVVFWATMEEAVYKMVGKHFGTLVGDTKEMEELQYKTSRMAGALLSILLSGESFAQSKDKVKVSNFLGKKRLVNLRHLSAVSIGDTVLLSLAAFVNGADDKSMFQNWPPDRNNLVHDGNLIDALYGPLDSTDYTSEINIKFNESLGMCLWRIHVGQELEYLVQAQEKPSQLLYNSLQILQQPIAWSSDDLEMWKDDNS